MTSFSQFYARKSCILLSPEHSTCPAHDTLLEMLAQITFGEEYRSVSSLLCSFLHSPVTSSLSGPNIFLNTRFLNTRSLCSSLNVREQFMVFHRGQIIMEADDGFILIVFT